MVWYPQCPFPMTCDSKPALRSFWGKIVNSSGNQFVHGMA